MYLDNLATNVSENAIADIRRRKTDTDTNVDTNAVTDTDTNTDRDTKTYTCTYTNMDTKNIKYQKYFGAGGIYQAPHLDNGNLATNVSNSPLSGSLPGQSIWVDFTPKSRKKKKTWQDKPVFPPERDT